MVLFFAKHQHVVATWRNKKSRGMNLEKRYDELSFTDDFMFCKILSTRRDICKELLELILDVEIKEVKLVDSQKTVEMTADGRGIRLDVYVNDCDNTIYDIEMQTTYMPDIAKRSRYYQGMIDLNLIERGARFGELRKSFIIFICMENPFPKQEKDLPIYTFRNICLEDKDVVLDDEASKIFLNAASKRNDIPKQVKELFEYFKGGAPANELCRKIEETVSEARSKDKWRAEYMTLLLRYAEKFDEGKAEGIKGTIYNLVRKGVLSPENGADYLGVTLEELETDMKRPN